MLRKRIAVYLPSCPPGHLKPPGGLDGFPATNKAPNSNDTVEATVASNEASHPQHQAGLTSVHSPALTKLRPVWPRTEAIPPRAPAHHHQPGPEAAAAGREAVLGTLPRLERRPASPTSSPSQPASHSQLQSSAHLIASQPSKPAPPTKQCQDPATQEMEAFIRPRQE